MVIANQVTVKTEDESADEVKGLLNEIALYAKTLKGCLKYEFYQLDNERTSFIIMEIWKSKKALKKFEDELATLELHSKVEAMIESRTVIPLRLTQCLTKQTYWTE